MQLKTFLAAAAAAGLSMAQNATMMNLTAALNSTSELSGLSALLAQYPDFSAQLANLTNVTILAPNNDALSALTSGNNTDMLGDQSAVEALLNYHILQVPLYADNVTSTPAFAATYLNDTAYTNVTGGQVVEIVLEDDNVVVYSGYRNNATVTEANVNFTGGVIHVIDQVLTIPGSLVDTAVVAGLTDLVGALLEANLSDAVSGLNSSTFFGPTNDAFSAIGSLLGNATSDQLASILQYHVINGTVAYTSTLVNGSVPTLEGANVTISLEDGAVFVNQARVIVADVLVANGVCHVIDSVLNPNNTNATANPTASPTGAFSGASSGSVDLTSGVPSATRTAGGALTSPESFAASGYTTPTGSIGGNPTNAPGGAGGTSSSSSGMAPGATGVIGAAALFGAGAFMANF